MKKYDEKQEIYVAEAKDIKKMLPERRFDMNKGDAGKVLLVAGSKAMAGAAVLAAKAAYKSGAGLVKVAAVWEVVQVIQYAVPEATCLILSDDANNNIRLISEEAKTFDSVVVGPGLGKAEETAKLVEHIIKTIPKPKLIDADAINLVSKNTAILKEAANVVMTPHPGEMGRLIGESAAYVNENRLSIAKSFASEYNVTLVLKGAGSIIACPKGITYINETGNSAMATAGSGDVLSGVIGAFLAAGRSAGESAVAGVYVHGLSGDICRQKIGDYGTTASDIAVFVAEALRKLTQTE